MREAVKQLKRLYADKQALEAKAQQADSEEKELEECQDLLECALNRWDFLPFEKQRRFVKLVVEQAVLERLYPHADRLDILKALPTRTWESITKRARGYQTAYVPG